jgi:hypothetical protein
VETAGPKWGRPWKPGRYSITTRLYDRDELRRFERGVEIKAFKNTDFSDAPGIDG